MSKLRKVKITNAAGKTQAVIYNGDCLAALKGMPDNSVDSIVTDPPAGIAFMGKEWDKDKGGRDGWIAWMQSIASEALRVLKPGGHALVWSIPRTSHWTATSWENAGFEVRDKICHIFGNGFPKGRDIGKAIDEEAGAAPATEAAKQWTGWSTTLKPASEDWWLLRKPLSEKTLAKNLLKWGTGALNIDGCRIGTDTITVSGDNKGFHMWKEQNGRKTKQVANKPPTTHTGRWPANLMHDGSDEVTSLFPVTGSSKSGVRDPNGTMGYHGGASGLPGVVAGYNDNGGSAARFFYCAKASVNDKEEGLAGLLKARQVMTPLPKENDHPTVKPTALMQYLCRLITPPGGIVLDLFMGSGSTGKAAIKEGFRFVGCDLDNHYCNIAYNRISHEIDKQ